ncbi:MAG: tetratricopeptide repeat protein [Saprospiraceae bacterium]
MRPFLFFLLIISLLHKASGQNPAQLVASLNKAQSAAEKVKLLDSLSMVYLDGRMYKKAIIANLDAFAINEKTLKDSKITRDLTKNLHNKIFESIPSDNLKTLSSELDSKYLVANFYNGLSRYFRKKDPYYARACAEEALKVSKQPRDSLLAHDNIGYSLLRQFQFKEVEPHFEIARRISHETKDTFMMIEVLINLGQLYSQTYNLNKATECYTEAMNLYQKWPYADKETKTLLQSRMAYVYRNKGNLDKAIDIRKELIEAATAEKDTQTVEIYCLILAEDLMRTGAFKEALPLFKNGHKWLLGNMPEQLVNFSLDLGECYFEMGVYDSALVYFHETIDYAKRYGQNLYACDTYNFMADLYAGLGDTIAAQQYDEKAYACYSEYLIGDEYAHAEKYDLFSHFHQKRGHLDSALVAIDKGLEIVVRNEINARLSGFLIRKGELLYEQKMFERAGQVLGEAQQAAREHGLSKEECDAYYIMAMAQSELKLYPEALEHALQAEQVAREINYSKRLQDIYKLLAVIYHRLGDGEQAYLYHLKYTELKDSLYGFVQKDRLAKYETQFQVKEKEMENELLVIEKERQAAVLKKRTLLLVAAGVAILLLAVASLLYIRWSKTRAQKLLRRQIAKDIHDDVGGILNYMYLTAKDAMEQSPDIPVVKDKLQKAIALNDQAVMALKDLIWKMESKPVPLAHFAGRLRAYTTNIFDDISVPHKLEVDGFGAERKLPSDTQYHFFMMYKEVLHNAIKHGDGGPINISLLHQDRVIELTVSNPFSVSDGHGADSYGGGHGLKNMRERAARLKGDLDISQETNTFTVRLKINAA